MTDDQRQPDFAVTTGVRHVCACDHWQAYAYKGIPADEDREMIWTGEHRDLESEAIQDAYDYCVKLKEHFDRIDPESVGTIESAQTVN